MTAASALSRRFALPLLEGVLGGEVGDALHELQRLGLIQQSRRWPQPEYRFRHALIQETAYRTLLDSTRAELHRRAAEWLEERYAGREAEVLGLLAHHWLAARNEDKATDYLPQRANCGGKAQQGYALTTRERSSTTAPSCRCSSGGASSRRCALVLFKLALALHTSLRFAEANTAYQRAFDHWTPPVGGGSDRTASNLNELPSERRRSEVCDRVAEHPALHAALRSARGGVARADDRALARGAVGDFRRRAALRLSPA